VKGYNEGSLNVVTILHTDRPSPLSLLVLPNPGIIIAVNAFQNPLFSSNMSANPGIIIAVNAFQNPLFSSNMWSSFNYC
jgi:hypothetical protein